MRIQYERHVNKQPSVWCLKVLNVTTRRWPSALRDAYASLINASFKVKECNIFGRAGQVCWCQTHRMPIVSRTMFRNDKSGTCAAVHSLWLLDFFSRRISDFHKGEGSTSRSQPFYLQKKSLYYPFSSKQLLQRTKTEASHYAAFRYFIFGPDIFLRTLFSKILSLSSPLYMRDQIWYPVRSNIQNCRFYI